jgi:hypothetical protein
MFLMSVLEANGLYRRLSIFSAQEKIAIFAKIQY